MRGILCCALAVGSIALAAPAETANSAAPNAVRLTKYVLGVADMDKTWAFYKSLGVELAGNATELKKPGPGAGVKQLTDTPDGTIFRAQMFKIPNATDGFQLEFTEFTHLDVHPARPRMQDPGASVMILRVRDLQSALAAAKSNGGTVVTTGGQPMPLGKDGKTRVIFVRDPDGYYVEFQQPDPIPAGAPAGNIISAAFGSVVNDAEKAALFYRDKFGFEAQVFDWNAAPAATQLAGIEKGQMRRSLVTIPGTKLQWEFISYKGVDRKAYTPRIPDPGAPALGFQVRDIDAAAAAIKAAGGSIVSAGGEIIRRPNGSAVAFMRDPNGLLLEVAQPAAQQ